MWTLTVSKQEILKESSIENSTKVTLREWLAHCVSISGRGWISKDPPFSTRHQFILWEEITRDTKKIHHNATLASFWPHTLGTWIMQVEYVTTWNILSDGRTVATRIGCQLWCGLTTPSSVVIRNLSMIHSVQFHMITEYLQYIFT